MTTTKDTQRDDLARDIFLADNSSGPEEVILGDWTDLEQAEAGASYAHRIANGLIAAGYRKPRTITTVEELDALPEGSVILTNGGEDSAQKDGEGEWYLWGGDFGLDSEDTHLPAIVLWEPEA